MINRIFFNPHETPFRQCLVLPGLLVLLCVSPAMAFGAQPASSPGSGLDEDAPRTAEPVRMEPPRELKKIELQASAIKSNNYPIDLGTVLKLVEDQNLQIAESEKKTQVLHSRLRQRQAAILPNIEGSYVQSRFEGGQQLFGGNLVTVTRETVNPQLTASWTIHPGGRTIFEMLAARRRKDAAEAQLEETYQEQLARASEEYYRLLATHLKKGVVIQSIVEAQEQVNLNEAKMAIGTGAPLDLSRAQTNLAQRKSALFQAENEIITAEQNLLNRLNLETSINLIPSELDAVQKTLIPESFPVEELIEEAIHSNPAIKTSIEELDALGLDYKAIRSNLIPSVTLRAYQSATGQTFEHMERTNFRGVTLNMNLMENMGLQVPYRMQESKKLIEQKLLAQKKLVRDIENQVMTAYRKSENYKSAMDFAEQEMVSAQTSYRLAVERFKDGHDSNLDVLSAEVALASARTSHAQAVLNYNKAQIRLVEALGRVTPEILLGRFALHDADDSRNASH